MPRTILADYAQDNTMHIAFYSRVVQAGSCCIVCGTSMGCAKGTAIVCLPSIQDRRGGGVLGKGSSTRLFCNCVKLRNGGV